MQQKISSLGKFDIVFSNAAIQRMTGHEELIKKWYALLNTGGTIAIQSIILIFPLWIKNSIYELKH